jgi:hypothetical protein
MLWVQRSRTRMKRSSSVEGKVIEATACSGGKAVKGVLCRRRRAPAVGSVEDLKHASGKNLLSVERVTCTPDIYIGGQMRDMRSLRCVAHFFQACCTLFLDEKCTFSEACRPFVFDGKHVDT